MESYKILDKKLYDFEIKINNLKKIECENKELLEKIDIFSNSLEILKKYRNHKLFKQEILYQQYRVKFSKFYFKISAWYVGNSWIKFINSKPVSVIYPYITYNVITMIFAK